MQVPGIGAARLRLLLAAFETAQGALTAPHGAIATLPGFSKAAATAIRSQSRFVLSRVYRTHTKQ